jgi:hypothetical protein
MPRRTALSIAKVGVESSNLFAISKITRRNQHLSAALRGGVLLPGRCGTAVGSTWEAHGKQEKAYFIRLARIVRSSLEQRLRVVGLGKAPRHALPPRPPRPR